METINAPGSDPELDAAAHAFIRRARDLGYDATVIWYEGADMLRQIAIEGGNDFIRDSTTQPQDRWLLRHFLEADSTIDVA